MNAKIQNNGIKGIGNEGQRGLDQEFMRTPEPGGRAGKLRAFMEEHFWEDEEYKVPHLPRAWWPGKDIPKSPDGSWESRC